MVESEAKLAHRAPPLLAWLGVAVGVSPLVTDCVAVGAPLRVHDPVDVTLLVMLRVPDPLAVAELLDDAAWLAVNDELRDRDAEIEGVPDPLLVWLPVAVGVSPDVTVCVGEGEALALWVPLLLGAWLFVPEPEALVDPLGVWAAVAVPLPVGLCETRVRVIEAVTEAVVVGDGVGLGVARCDDVVLLVMVRVADRDGERERERVDDAVADCEADSEGEALDDADVEAVLEPVWDAVTVEDDDCVLVGDPSTTSPSLTWNV